MNLFCRKQNSWLCGLTLFLMFFLLTFFHNFINAEPITIDTSLLTLEQKIFYGDRDISSLKKEDLLQHLRQITGKEDLTIDDFAFQILFDPEVQVPEKISIQFKNKYNGEIAEAIYRTIKTPPITKNNQTPKNNTLNLTSFFWQAIIISIFIFLLIKLYFFILKKTK